MAGDAPPTKPLTATEISKQSNEITKALAASSTPADYYARALKDLRLGVSATEDLLRSTRIGVVVNKVKDHVKDEKVREQATALIKKWKSDIAAKKRAGGESPALSAAAASSAAAKAGSGASTPRAGAPAAGTATTASGGAAAGNGQEKWKATKPESRNAVVDGVDWKKTGSNARDACAKSLYDGLAFMSERGSYTPQTRTRIPDLLFAAPSHILPIALATEKAIFESFGPESSTAYRDKIRTLFLNLKNKSNGHLRDAVTGVPPKYTPAQLAHMSSEDMKSDELVEADKVRHKENIHNAMTAKEQKAVSSMLKCSSCGQRKVSYTQAQTRSADEPMTTFCECQVCGKKWKFS